MRVLLIANGYPPWRRGGTETYTAGIARGLARLGHDVSVLCGGEWESGPRHWNGVSRHDDDGVSVSRIHLNWAKAPDPGRYLYDNCATAGFLREHLERLRPDVVHVTSCETLSASVIPVVKDAGLPLVLSLTDFWFLCPRINLLRSDGRTCDGNTSEWECLRCQLRGQRALEVPAAMLPEPIVQRVLTAVSRVPALTRRPGLRGMACNLSARKSWLRHVLTLPDRRVTASAFTRAVFAAAGVDAPIELHAYGHDLSWRRAVGDTRRSDRLRIGFVGQISESKGLHVLLDAVAQLPARLQAALEVVVYGDVDREPDYGAGIRAAASALGAPVDLRGVYLHRDSADVFASMDVLVVPSLWYDFPLVIHEAFAAGVPVVASDLAGMSEAVGHGINGLLFDRGSSVQLAGALTRLVEEPELVAALRDRVPDVKTVDDEVAELEQLYAEVALPAPPREAISGISLASLFLHPDAWLLLSVLPW